MHLSRACSRRVVAGVLAGGLLLAGCTGDEPQPQETQAAIAPSAPTAPTAPTAPSPPSAADPSASEPDGASPSATGSAPAVPSPSASAPERPLDDEWYVDSDGNLVPDFVETELGYDPTVDDCALEVDCPGANGAAAIDELTRDQNVLLVLDASGSMAGDAGGGQTKIEAAREALERYVTGTPDYVNLGFTVYGHRGTNEPSGQAESCAGVETLSGIGEVAFDSFPQVLAQFEPTGYTPVAGALQEAGTAFAGLEGGDNRVILVSDGIETCGGDPVTAAQALKDAGIAVTVDVVGFDVPDSDAASLRRVAEVTGGTYTSAATGAELSQYFEGLRAQRRELTQAIICLATKTTEFNACQAGFTTDVNVVLADAGLDADLGGDTEQSAAITELANQIQEREAVTSEVFRGDLQVRIDEVIAQIEAADQRLGAEVSRIDWWPCVDDYLAARLS